MSAATIGSNQPAPAPIPEPESVAPSPAPVGAEEEQEAGWVKRLVCDLVDATILSTLRAGVASHAATATGFVATVLSDGGRCGFRSLSFPV